ncbi:DUF4198 domain-containing protein [Hymenobacter mucosus]|uniref:Uncharacterized conserved protein, contains GH25 family domain n=1 Tax=Hymenobacter mucosus TaxID=1411120 RepID=A0A238XZ02_9BACT|nr:DUF4198 domain-containing protein [Hymenobacter mucosus]SNR64276.1 Uncharacterized conserved protein, contains GH25 family domain [Hymenobacter mucosus]
MTRRLHLLVSLLLLGGTAIAQEFWLEPVRFIVAPGAVVHLRRLMGRGFQQPQRWAGRSSRLTTFRHYAPGQLPVDLLPTMAAADTLQSTLTIAQPGTHLLALATNDAYSTLAANEFNDYLREAKLDYIVALRQQREEMQKPGREAYRRCAKTLVQAGPVSAADTARAWSRATGLPLELVPEQNPYALHAGASLTLRVLAAGRPVPGQVVQVWQRTSLPAAPPLQLRSNQNGRVLFRLSGPGDYLVSTVRMTPALNHPQAEWQSTWSTLSFGFKPDR